MNLSAQISRAYFFVKMEIFAKNCKYLKTEYEHEKTNKCIVFPCYLMSFHVIHITDVSLFTRCLDSVLLPEIKCLNNATGGKQSNTEYHQK